MGREVRRVPKDWQHPKDDRGYLIPMFDESYTHAIEGWIEDGQAWLAGTYEYQRETDDRTWRTYTEYCGEAPRPEDYMPDWPESEKTHLMMYEDTSEGTPISPPFETAEELARWLADTSASAFGSRTATYEAWLATIKAGFAVSMIADKHGLRSGVEAS